MHEYVVLKSYTTTATIYLDSGLPLSGYPKPDPRSWIPDPSLAFYGICDLWIWTIRRVPIEDEKVIQLKCTVIHSFLIYHFFNTKSVSCRRDFPPPKIDVDYQSWRIQRIKVVALKDFSNIHSFYETKIQNQAYDKFTHISCTLFQTNLEKNVENSM